MLTTGARSALAGLRVLQVGPLYNNHLRRWSAHAAALGCTVYAAGHVTPGRRPAGLAGVAEQVEVAPDALYVLGDAPNVAWLRGVIRRLEPDLIHAHWLPKWGYLAARSGPRPLVVTAWGSDLYLANGAQRSRADWALRHVDRVLARSHHMQREMAARGVSAERLHQVDLGVDLERFRPASEGARVRIRKELGLPDGPIVLSMRAGTELYNLDVVLDAFRDVRSRLPNATLVLVHGDAPLSRPVRTLLHKLGGSPSVRVVGQVKHAEMPKYVMAATAGVSIPSSDGSPSSVWEALAGGLPMVLSQLPQIEEKVGCCEAVRLVEPRRDVVARALGELLESPTLHDRMARAGRAWAVDHIGEREQIARLGRVYATMLGADSGSGAATGIRSPISRP